MGRPHLKNFFFIAVGSAIMSLGVNAFNLANNLTLGGASGLAVLFKFLFDIDPGISMILINIPLFALGWRVLGRNTLIYSIWATLCVSLFLALFGTIRMPLEDMLLASLFAGVFIGAGLGIVFRYGGTTGGSDIVARMCGKWFGFKIGRTLFVADVIVIAVSMVYLSLEQAMYTAVSLFVYGKIIDMVQDEANAARAVTVISSANEEISTKIIGELQRGVTFLQGEGGYLKESKQILFTVVSKREIGRLKKIVLEADSNAFISIAIANEVLGPGFSLGRNAAPTIPVAPVLPRFRSHQFKAQA